MSQSLTQLSCDVLLHITSVKGSEVGELRGVGFNEMRGRPLTEVPDAHVENKFRRRNGQDISRSQPFGNK